MAASTCIHRDTIKASLFIALGLSICSGCAYLGSSIMPFQIDALMSALQQSASRAGLFGFFEIMAFSVFMLLFSRMKANIPAVVTALVGAGGVIISSLMVVWGPVSVLWIWGCAVLFGLAEALLGRSYVCAASASENPDRMYALSNGGGQVVLIAVISIIPYTNKTFGKMGVFIGLSSIVALLSPFLLTLRRAPSAPCRSKSNIHITSGVIALLAIWVGSSFGASLLWSFAERVGRSIKISEDYIVFLSTIGIISSIVVSFIGGIFSDKLPRSVMLPLTLVMTAIGGGFVCCAWNDVSYIFGVIMYWIGSMLSYAWLLGSAAALDHTGQVGTFCGGMDRMGYALGAALGGVIVDHASFTVLGIIGALSCIISLPFCLPILLRDISYNEFRESH